MSFSHSGVLMLAGVMNNITATAENKKYFPLLKRAASIACMANTISVSVIWFHVMLDNVGHSDSDWGVCYLETNSVLTLFCFMLLLSDAILRYSGLCVG